MYDYLIIQGRIADGTGNGWFHGDIGITDGRIAAIGKLKGQLARNTVDASGMIVCPGFIDMHTHSDFSILRNRKAENSIMQGVTTEVIGNCGNGAFPISESKHHLYEKYLNWILNSVGESLSSFDDRYLKNLHSMGINIVPLIAHGNVRIAVMGYGERKPAEDDMIKMESIVEKYMKAGAFGLSTGLVYPPGSYSDIAELVRLNRVVARYGGFYASHIRDEGDSVIGAVDESIQIAQLARVPLHISHHKITGAANWGKSLKTLSMIDRARARGIDTSLDVYPYTAPQSSIMDLLPGLHGEDNCRDLFNLINEKAVRNKVHQIIDNHDFKGWDKVILSTVQTSSNRHLEGMSISAIAEIQNKDIFEVICDLLIEENGQVSIFYDAMCEDDLSRILQHPFCAIGSDGWAEDIDEAEKHSKVHPRNYGTFARVLGRYAMKLGVLRLEEAIRKMTSLPASRLGLLNRGLIRYGMAADIVIFDENSITDTATFTNPRSFPTGIHHVFVNGVLVVDDGMHTGETPGRLLLK